MTHPLINKLKHNRVEPRVSFEQLVAARRAEMHKKKIYEANGSYKDFPVVPAILETFGGFGPEFIKLLKSVSRFDAHHSAQVTLDRLISRVAVLLVKGNHALELSGVPKAMAAYAGQHFAPFYSRGALAVFE